MKNWKVCAYCGSRFGDSEGFRILMENLGSQLVQNKMDLVYGGGRVGLMGALASSVMKAGGQVTGIIPEGLFGKEVADQSISDLIVVQSMHERKALMEKRSDGFLALPGGWGTLDEFFEILTWAQIGIHQKPIGLLNFEGFFDPLLTQIQQMVRHGFVSPGHQDLFYAADNVPELLAKMKELLERAPSKSSF